MNIIKFDEHYLELVEICFFFFFFFDFKNYPAVDVCGWIPQELDVIANKLEDNYCSRDLYYPCCNRMSLPSPILPQLETNFQAPTKGLILINLV